MTKRALAALQILKDEPGLSASEFASKFWPDHVMHRAVSNQGHGACVGKKAWVCGGRYLGKLVKQKLVEAYSVGQKSYTRVRYKLTQNGRTSAGE